MIPMELVFDSTNLYGGHTVRTKIVLRFAITYNAVGLKKIIHVLDKRGQKATKSRAKKARVLSSPSSSVAPLDAPSWAVSAPQHISTTNSLESEVS